MAGEAGGEAKVWDSEASDCELGDLKRAIDLVQTGARLLIPKTETVVNFPRLCALYEEVTGRAPCRAEPLLRDWFQSWQVDIHTALFVSTWRYQRALTGARAEAITRAYRMYLAHVQVTGADPFLTVTRAWTLARYLDVLVGVSPCIGCFHDRAITAEQGDWVTACTLCRGWMATAVAQSAGCSHVS